MPTRRRSIHTPHRPKHTHTHTHKLNMEAHRQILVHHRSHIEATFVISSLVPQVIESLTGTGQFSLTATSNFTPPSFND